MNYFNSHATVCPLILLGQHRMNQLMNWVLCKYQQLGEKVTIRVAFKSLARGWFECLKKSLIYQKFIPLVSYTPFEQESSDVAWVHWMKGSVVFAKRNAICGYAIYQRISFYIPDSLSETWNHGKLPKVLLGYFFHIQL